MKFRRHGKPTGSRRGAFEFLGSLARSVGKARLFERFTAWIGPVGSRRRNRFVTVAALVTAFLVGYVVAATLLFPAPIFPRSRDVPRLLGMPLSQAREELDRIGLSVADTEFVSHPEFEQGRIVWQDPPPAVAVPEGGRLTLSVSRGPRPVQVPDVTGYQRELATHLIEAAGLSVARVDTGLAPAERGVVVSSNPTAGRSLNPGSGVGLFVSVGTATIRIPNLIGLTVEEAEDLLEEAGLALGTATRRTTTNHDPDLIFEQSPAEGTLSASGAAVNVTVARGG